MKNDIWITHWEREVKNKTRELADAIRDKPEWIVMQRASELSDAATNLRLRALHIGFEKYPPAVTPPEV